MARMEHVPDRIRAIQKPDRNAIGPLQVYVFYGSSGKGKSTAARELFPEIYDIPISNTGKLWFTARGNMAKHVLFEDFDGASSKLGLKEFNRLLDPFPLEVEKKGSYIWYCPCIVIITTNVTPAGWYNYDSRQDVRSQVYRRITGIYDFNTPEGRDLVEMLTADTLEQRYPTQPKRVLGIGFHPQPPSVPTKKRRPTLPDQISRLQSNDLVLDLTPTPVENLSDWGGAECG